MSNPVKISIEQNGEIIFSKEYYLENGDRVIVEDMRLHGTGDKFIFDMIEGKLRQLLIRKQ